MNKDNSQSRDGVFEMILDSSQVGAVTAQASSADASDWSAHTREGQLAIDVAQTADNIVIISTLAGATIGQLEIYVHNDLLTIRGTRHSTLDDQSQVDYYLRECFWGNFSRTVVLPVDVKGDLARAEYKNGVLTVTIPKQLKHKKIPITVVDE
jgi:HSP20 family protein